MNEARRLVLRYVLSVVALHAVAIVLYMTLDVEHRDDTQRRVFLIAWTALTLVVVLVGLGRLRKARVERRRRA